MTRSASTAREFETSLTALLVIGSILSIGVRSDSTMACMMIIGTVG